MVALRSNYTRLWWHKTILILPLFGKLAHYINLTLFGRTLSTLLNSGVPINKAIETTSTMLRNEVYRNALLQVSIQQKSGKLFLKLIMIVINK